MSVSLYQKLENNLGAEVEEDDQEANSMNGYYLKIFREINPNKVVSLTAEANAL